MILTALLAFLISPADSARELISIRYIPEAAIIYSQMAAAEDGSWMLEFGRLLEASGRFSDARRIYGIALGNSTSTETSDWLINRRLGVTPIDTTLVITATVLNTGDITAWGVQVILPMPVPHPPFQNITIIQNDFSSSGGLLSADIPFITPGHSIELSVTLHVLQRPGSARPVSQALSDENLAWITETIRTMRIPAALPGPCVPMSEEMARLAEEQGLTLKVEGGVILDRTGCIFHAWNVLENPVLRIDPLLFKTDSLLGFAHNPTDVIPLWDLGPTDGYELNLLYQNPDCRLQGSMKIEAR